MALRASDRRKDYRLPFGGRTVLTDGRVTLTAYAGNISRGGMFLLTLTPFSIETPLNLSFLLPQHPGSLSLKGQIAHIVMDNKRCEVDCGIGVSFLELNDAQKTILNVHMANQKTAFLDLRKLLSLENPDLAEIDRYREILPTLKNLDLLALRYRVERVCTLFEPSADGEQEQLSA